MDTSETYIKMRMAAIPDLGLGCKPRTPFHYITDSVHVDEKGDFYYSNVKDELNQLERQDQLQEMVDSPAIEWLLDKFWYWAREGHNISPILNTWEQLWLAFVMKEKYQRKWGGEEWIA